MTVPRGRERWLLMAIGLATLAAFVAIWLVAPPRAQAQEYTAADTLAAIDEAAAELGVDRGRMYRIVGCETGWTFSPRVEGDRGHSHGVAQLNDFGNALPRFYEVGYTDPYNPYQAVYFMAEALAGMHPHLGRHTWNC